MNDKLTNLVRLMKNNKLIVVLIFSFILVIIGFFSIISINNDNNEQEINKTNEVVVNDLKDFKKENEKYSKEYMINEISNEKKANLSVKLNLALSEILKNNENYIKEMDERIKKLSASTGLTIKKYEIAKEKSILLKNKEHFKKNIDRLNSINKVLSGDSGIIVNGDLELAISKQIEEIKIEGSSLISSSLVSK